MDIREIEDTSGSIMSGHQLDQIEEEFRNGDIPDHLRNPPDDMAQFDAEVARGQANEE